MIRWAARMPFRVQLTLWWTLAFGLLLAVANLAIYTAFDAYLGRDLDRKVRTVAATELASSTDGPGIHLHPLPKEALAEGEYTDKFVQILSVDGACGWRRRRSGICRRWWDPTRCRRPSTAARRSCPSSSADGPAGRPCSEPTIGGQRYAVMVGIFRDDIDAHLSRLAWVLVLVWVAGLATTSALGYWLASRALAPVVGISRRAARIARGEFAARLDPPVAPGRNRRDDPVAQRGPRSPARRARGASPLRVRRLARTARADHRHGGGNRRRVEASSHRGGISRDAAESCASACRP